MWVKLISPGVSLRPMDSDFKRRMAPPLSLLVLGALTPERHRVTIADENVERLHLDDRPDLVGITVKVDTAVRAWEISQHYRQRGIPVVLGGLFPTMCPEDNADHADACVIGEAEELWGKVLCDAERGCLKKVYRNESPPDLALTPVPRWDLLARRRYLYTNTVTIGRGCPWRCDFCYNSSPNLPAKYRAKPIHNIVEEIASLNTRHVMFIDDNFIADPAFARELLKTLKPLGLTWHTAVSADIGRRDALLDLMAEAGCQSLFIGFESMNPKNLQATHKRQNVVEQYERTVTKIHERGMMVNASVVFGFDHDGPEVFDRTTQWLIEHKIETMTAHILTPYPGTVLYSQLQAEGRIFDHDLTHYNTSRVVFHPRNMTADELEKGYLGTYRRFYSWGSILERMPTRTVRCAPYLLFNICYRKYGKILAPLSRGGLMYFVGRLGRLLSYTHRGS